MNAPIDDTFSDRDWASELSAASKNLGPVDRDYANALRGHYERVGEFNQYQETQAIALIHKATDRVDLHTKTTANSSSHTNTRERMSKNTDSLGDIIGQLMIARSTLAPELTDLDPFRSVTMRSFLNAMLREGFDVTIQISRGVEPKLEGSIGLEILR
jgi:hypothetical protein